MQRPDSVRAVVFDFDGLLADTEKPWGVAESAMFTSRGFHYGDAERELFLGAAVGDVVAIMADRFGEPQADVLADYIARVRRELTADSAPMPGAMDLLRSLRVPYAVASNTPRELLDLSLAGSGLDALVSLSVCADEVAAGKPAPDVYLRACELLGVAPSDAVAVEDSRTGAAAARAAGMTVIMVPSGPWEPGDAHLVVDALTHPELRAWLG